MSDATVTLTATAAFNQSSWLMSPSLTDWSVGGLDHEEHLVGVHTGLADGAEAVGDRDADVPLVNTHSSHVTLAASHASRRNRLGASRSRFGGSNGSRTRPVIATDGHA